eukprot:m.209519 g.209519  ORF g.209519 m.209519 type:complete len:100 (+) comp15816_c0_seq28:1210-1509(+)
MVEVSKAFIVKSAARDTFVKACAMELGSELPALGDPVTGHNLQSERFGASVNVAEFVASASGKLEVELQGNLKQLMALIEAEYGNRLMKPSSTLCFMVL